MTNNIKKEWAEWATIKNGDFIAFRDFKHTLKHKIRLAVGIHGQMPSGKYCFNPPFKTRFWYKFMFYIGDPVLNFIIGYERLK